MAVNEWAVTFGTARRGLDGAAGNLCGVCRDINATIAALLSVIMIVS